MYILHIHSQLKHKDTQINYYMSILMANKVKPTEREQSLCLLMIGLAIADYFFFAYFFFFPLCLITLHFSPNLLINNGFLSI